MKQRTADPYRDLDVIDARAPRFNQATSSGRSRSSRFSSTGGRSSPSSPASLRGSDSREAVVPPLPRLLRARPAHARRGPDRGLASAALRERDRRGLVLGAAALAHGPASRRSAGHSGFSSPGSHSSPRPQASAPAARCTGSARACAGSARIALERIDLAEARREGGHRGRRPVHASALHRLP